MDVNGCEGVFAPLHQFLSFFFVLALEDQFEVEIPNVKVENYEAFVVGVVFGVSGGEEIVEGHFPINCLVLK